MSATLTQERFTGPEWIFERKFDGIRLLAFKQAGTCGCSRAIVCRTTTRR
jgi:ATP-dependent DNA ligase